MSGDHFGTFLAAAKTLFARAYAQLSFRRINPSTPDLVRGRGLCDLLEHDPSLYKLACEGVRGNGDGIDLHVIPRYGDQIILYEGNAIVCRNGMREAALVRVKRWQTEFSATLKTSLQKPMPRDLIRLVYNYFISRCYLCT
jgi:hypothetical protein